MNEKEKFDLRKLQSEDEVRVHTPFSPTILEFKVPQKFLDIVNTSGDAVLPDDGLSKKFDFSDNLVGKVSKEVRIPVSEAEDRNYMSNIIKGACVGYLKNMIENNRAYEWRKQGGGDNPTIDNIHLAQSWIVSQYKNEYNPWHKHSGNFSGVCYLKLPEGMQDHFNEEVKDHYPASGLIEFSYGEPADMRSDTLMFKPEVGMMIVFPSWLKHTVYPFYCDGERRSMSFNAYFVTDAQIEARKKV
jgi:hypothetical protein